MIPVKQIDPDDLALYAMQLLPVEEMEEMSLLLQHSAEARRVLSEIYGDLSILAHSSEMEMPSAQARQRLMKQVQREKKPVPIDTAPAKLAPLEAPLMFEAPAKKSAAARVLPWVGWALAAGMVLPVVLFYQQREQMKVAVIEQDKALRQSESAAEQANVLMETMKAPTAVHVSLTSTGSTPPPEGRAVYVPEKGSLVFIASNLERLQPAKTYELWLIPKNGRDPVPAGIFRPDARGNASLLLPELPRGVEAAAFGVTIEDRDGASTPTMPIILKGTAS